MKKTVLMFFALILLLAGCGGGGGGDSASNSSGGSTNNPPSIPASNPPTANNPPSSNPAPTLWTLDNTYHINKIVADANGVYVVGATNGGSAIIETADAFVAKFKLTGELEWTKMSATSNGDDAHAAVLTPSGKLLVLEDRNSDLSKGSSNFESWLVCYMPDGSFCKKSDGKNLEILLGSNISRGFSVIAIDENENIFLGGGEAINGFVMMLNSDGDYLWYQITVGVGVVSVDYYNGVFYASILNAIEYPAYVQSYDKSGKMLGSWQYSESGKTIAIRDMFVNSTGIYPVGYAFDKNMSSYEFLMKLDFSGNVLWKVVDAGGYNMAISGTETAIYTGGDAIKSFDPFSGKLLWQKTTNGVIDLTLYNSTLYEVISSDSKGTIYYKVMVELAN